ncbi:hypothetical protein P3S67_011630 [Capsicum chacoense]
MDSYYFIPKEGPLHTTAAGIVHRKCQMIRTFLSNINTRHSENIQGNFNVYQYEDADAATRYGVEESEIVKGWILQIVGSMPKELLRAHKDKNPQMDTQKPQKGTGLIVGDILRAFIVLRGMYQDDFKADKHKVVKINWTDFTTQFEQDMEGLQPRFTVQMAASGVVDVTLFDCLYGILDEVKRRIKMKINIQRQF